MSALLVPSCAPLPASVPRTATPRRATSVVLGVPAYFRPGATWATALGGEPAVAYMVANPASGPGPSCDPAYAPLAETSRASGVRVLGYVSTRWGQRPPADVQRDIAAYRDWYGISDVFLDEVATSAAALPYYRRLARVVQGRNGGTLALNPGTVPFEGYAALADLLVVFEGPCSSYDAWAPPRWQERYPTCLFWHLVYATPADRASAALRTAARTAADVVYLTDDVLDNPWDQLPSYWSDLVGDVTSGPHVVRPGGEHAP